MKATGIKTPIVHIGDNLEKILLDALPNLPEKSILVVTCKIIALSEGSVAERKLATKKEKWAVVQQQAELYTDPGQSQYNLMLTVKDQIMAVNAGIDESNADGAYVLFPKNAYASAEKIWRLLRDHYQIKQLGVLIIDSKTFPLKWGTIGTALAYCGFQPVNDRRGEKDLFGYEMVMTKENIAEGLAAAANVEMGEVAEQKPLCLIENLEKVVFQDHPPTPAEIEELNISIVDDVYAPVLTKANWQKGGHHQSKNLSGKSHSTTSQQASAKEMIHHSSK
ncbi:MAG: hypothetical protein COY81_00550 [Candidatus Pacebacteria bacterium CG_4_10_14_0_8_um_filter_43_12]